MGDLHGRFNLNDVQFFRSSEHGLLVFLGDISSGSQREVLELVRRLARIDRSLLLLPGNNDAPHYPELAAEFAHRTGMLRLLGAAEGKRGPELKLVAYQVFRVETLAGPVALLFGRPFAMGGSELSFPELLERVHGVRSEEDSRERYRGLFQAAGELPLIVISHNGPWGLGGEPDAPFGRDFQLKTEAPRDWGDADLAWALHDARSRGQRIWGVFSGHMHRAELGQSRLWTKKLSGIPCYNAACVPRIVARGGMELHHFLELSFAADGLSVQERWTGLGGSLPPPPL